MEIIPAILTNDPEELREKVEIITKSNRKLVRRVQIDVIDGVFANNKTVAIESITEVESDLLYDMQLMVREPVDWVEKCVSAMAERVIGQIELMSDQMEFVAKCAEDEVEVGLGLDLPTEISVIDTEVLVDLDVILVMGVKAGFGGQKFSEVVIRKIEKLNELRKANGYRFRICVDGGVNETNIKMIAEAGTDEVAIGKSLWTPLRPNFANATLGRQDYAGQGVGGIEERMEELLKLTS